MVFLIPVTRHQEHLIENLSQLFLFCMLAALVAYGTGCLAGRLAGCLAFAASTFFNCILKILRIQCLDMFHSPFLLSQLVFAMAWEAWPLCRPQRRPQNLRFTGSRASPFIKFDAWPLCQPQYRPQNLRFYGLTGFAL